jgi:transcriptional regulator with XRE-family HTH domain
MELGQKLRLARQEAGLSQRQLCGEVITRNMLSQIENGSAKPSMETLRYLAGRLGKSVSFFLDEDAVLSPNCKVMEQAREALKKQDAAALRVALDGYQSPDDVFEEERKLLTIHCLVLEAEEAVRTGREIYAQELLDRAEEVARTALYFTEELSGKILLLKSRLKSADLEEICRKLPSLDEVLILRAKGALAAGEFVRALHLLESVEEQDGADWNFLRGELYLIEKDYMQAAKCFHQAEEVMGQAVFSKLETCYREMENFQMAYTYACKQRNR